MHRDTLSYPADERLQCHCNEFGSLDSPIGAMRCERKATQEDMLCDVCRGGCTLAIGPIRGMESLDRPGFHLSADVDWSASGFSFTSRPSGS